ncbi:hypothetical protein ISS08_00480 [Candidatus Pacearchaeota archaeon]|nr:hypothetical protein [Candidatus Pacearchaeota archaeon]
MANKTKAVIWSLIAIIVVLALVMIYAFAVQPAITNRQNIVYTAGYNTAQVDFINGMLNQLQQQQYIQIPISENQSLFLAPFNPQQAAQQ